MAVNSNETHREHSPTKTICSKSSKSSKICSMQPYRSEKFFFATDDNMSIPNKRRKSKKMKDFKSPYLNDDRILLHSQVTEERLVLKKAKGIISSFNLAANIYKANSSEFKLPKRNKKVKKSVLTLPNKQAPAPQTCTVSDINDSEYDNPNSEHIMKRIKKKMPLQNSRKPRLQPKRDFEFYDRDAKYCSQMNIHLDCSSTDMFKNPNGDGRKFSNRSPNSKDADEYDSGNNPHDVWAVLRNINRFQFRPSPPMSEESDRTPKKRKPLNKKRNKRKDTRFDRITVIDNQDKFDEISQEFENRITQMKSRKSPKNKKIKSSNQNKLTASQSRKPSNSIAKTCKAKEYNDQRELCDSKDDYIPNIENISVETYVALDESNRTDGNRLITSPPKSTVLLQGPWNPNTVTLHTEIGTGKSSKSSIANCKYDELNDDFIFSDNFITEKEKGVKLSAEVTDQQIKGITKVVLSKGQNMALSRRLELQKKNARLIATMPKVITPPKLTQTEIKRQLRNIKFPLVVLGKDQVSSSIQIKNQDHPQFGGLDKQIWPFMLEWTDVNTKEDKSSGFSPERINFNTRVQKHRDDDMPVEFAKDPNKQINGKNTNVNVDSIQIKKKLEPKKPLVLTDIKLQANKPKPIRQLKDKVIKFLYKKPSFKNVAEEGLDNNYKIVASSNGNTRKVNASTKTCIERVISKDSSNSPPLITRRTPIARYPWSKGKWASDFIDTVIKKIKNGVYYNHENLELDQKAKTGPKEASIQTIQTSSTSISTYCDAKNLDTTTTLISENLDSLNKIPGFDNSFPVLEIKTLNMNQVEVKHSVTNIMVQFDVKVPMEPEPVLNVIKSSSVIDMNGTEQSNTQIFKCKTSILNAILPAELCSLLPKMLHRIMKANVKFISPLLVVNKTGSNLSTISEITRCESSLSSNSLTLTPTHIYMRPEIRRLSEGMFTNAMKMDSNYSVSKRSILTIYCNKWVMHLLPKLSKNTMFNYDKWHISHITPAIKQIPVSHSKEESFCTNTALVPYTGIDQSNISTVRSCDYLNIIKKLCINYNTTYNINIVRNSPIYINCALNNTYMNMSISNCFNGFKTNLYVNLNNIKIISLYNWFQKAFLKQTNDHSHEPDKNNNRCIKLIDNNKGQMKEIVKMEYCKKRAHTSHNKIRRKGFVKLSRKYKSTSNMCSEQSTSLSKISNLEDFLEIIGTGRQLSSIFDDRIGKKILSSLAEMKSWIPEINPRQAMLILLLMNKKDTPNLVRFRPLLLQGIAMNRITRGTELDMEIEVIERENLNKCAQYEGILYLEESVENHDNLLEELYWIAKTTASDYQKPFDESSENLLKSLLEKRKKLNPSYLRVMARYVGLGLLKSTIKTHNKIK